MVSSTNDLLVHTEVQYVQNFHGPHALHGAYWHDAWGEQKSGGCVNLAPDRRQARVRVDRAAAARGLVRHALGAGGAGPATVVVVQRSAAERSRSSSMNP